MRSRERPEINRSAYAPYAFSRALVRTLPSAWSARIAGWLGDRQRRSSALDRAAVQANLTAMLGRPVAAADPEVRSVFRHFLWYLFELLSSERWDEAGLSVSGAEEAAQGLRPFRGGILLSAHVGNWEVAAMALARLGVPIAAVALPHRDRRVDALFNGLRHRWGIGTIVVGSGASHEIIRRLRRGEWIGLMGDREFFGQGIPVRWFGRLARLPAGPAMLSLRTGCPILPVACVRERPLRLRMHVDEPILPDGLSRQPLAQRAGMALERLIRLAPEQWVIFRKVFDE